MTQSGVFGLFHTIVNFRYRLLYYVVESRAAGRLVYKGEGVLTSHIAFCHIISILHFLVEERSQYSGLTSLLSLHIVYNNDIDLEA